MSAALERSLRILELLAVHPEGCALSSVSSQLGMPLSATHRLLTALCEAGYIKQSREQGDYVLTMKLVSLGLGFLSNAGVVDIAQPMLERLAEESGELVRLGVLDGENLTFVGKAQGATRGLRYDPDMGLSVKLSCSAAGHAWLATLSDEEALGVVGRQGYGKPLDFGPNAPTSAKALLTYLRAARKRGFSMIVEVFAPGMSAMSAVVRKRDGEVIGVITIAGPLVRLTEQRMLSLGPALLRTAAEVGAAGGLSPLFKRAAAA
jgi:IclR family transcriptional regulator, acetate operon repressor